jgi:hypothetical protein
MTHRLELRTQQQQVNTKHATHNIQLEHTAYRLHRTALNAYNMRATNTGQHLPVACNVQHTAYYLPRNFVRCKFPTYPRVYTANCSYCSQLLRPVRQVVTMTRPNTTLVATLVAVNLGTERSRGPPDAAAAFSESVPERKTAAKRIHILPLRLRLAATTRRVASARPTGHAIALVCESGHRPTRRPTRMIHATNAQVQSFNPCIPCRPSCNVQSTACDAKLPFISLVLVAVCIGNIPSSSS